MTEHSRFVGYCRTSTAEQSISLEAQRARIEAWAASNGREIVSWCVEQASAKDIDRPELQHALNMLDDNLADGLVVVKVDRLSRSVVDFANLMDRFTTQDKALVCIGDSIDMTTPSGRFVATILSGLAQLERELIGARTKEALDELKRQGVRLGRPPSEDVDSVDRSLILHLAETSGYSQRKIAEVTGYKASTVRRILATSSRAS